MLLSDINGANKTCFLHVAALQLVARLMIYFHSKQILEDHRAIGRFCGSVLPKPFTTESNQLFITFETDIYYSGEGFEAIYHQAEGV